MSPSSQPPPPNSIRNPSEGEKGNKSTLQRPFMQLSPDQTYLAYPLGFMCSWYFLQYISWAGFHILQHTDTQVILGRWTWRLYTRLRATISFLFTKAYDHIPLIPSLSEFQYKLLSNKDTSACLRNKLFSNKSLQYGSVPLQCSSTQSFDFCFCFHLTSFSIDIGFASRILMDLQIHY
jgi:hypothetical protein